ncbi:uncharacterized protein N0V89_000938 [Didymosphaeria variabile]|uniref:Uncharacterized protein n=1 Tax=Didymosphaeria variabile TaxID=1932322 RepID=A0A9W8XW34_9PLEO|nr:uncharacterized protein N0V89_000938 [Didymosphaeria variabile]KAJ4360376.1 hypothetical protein N0V89_000938 [Didymosphaeria variabile]
MADPQHEIPVSTTPVMSDASSRPVAAAASARKAMPVKNATFETLSTMAASITLGAVSSTFTTLASPVGRAPATVDPPPDPPCASPFDLYSCPSEDYLPGIPPVLIALVCIVLAWTFLFAYAVYHLHQCDAIPHKLPAHPQWRQEENHHGQRSPKKAGGRFEMRGLGGKEMEKERESLGVFDGTGAREMVKLDSRGTDMEEKKKKKTRSGRLGGTVSRGSQCMGIGDSRERSWVGDRSKCEGGVRLKHDVLSDG